MKKFQVNFNPCIFYLFIFLKITCVFIQNWETHATVSMWKLEENLKEIFLSSYHLDPAIQVVRLDGHFLYLLTQLTDHFSCLKLCLQNEIQGSIFSFTFSIVFFFTTLYAHNRLNNICYLFFNVSLVICTSTYVCGGAHEHVCRHTHMHTLQVSLIIDLFFM